jgi:drug/metabolite transporter (DMT)-like permease
MTTEPRLSERSLLIAAFAAIYVIWGSTYLAIRLLAETLPGLSGMAVRFLVAGALLYAWARWRGAAKPTRAHWRAGTLTGGLMLCGGGGGVVVAIRHLDSGLVALLVGMVPLWIAFLLWFWPGGRRPSLPVVAALLIGFGGVAILAAPGDVLGGEPIHLPSVLVMMLACLSWGVGSLVSRGVELPRSPHLVSALQMLTGGAFLLTWGLLDGEWEGFDPQGVSATSVLALLYLIFLGSIVAFSAYSWLIRTAEPTQVATYAYVNPVVAVFLGWLIADEPVGGRTLVAAALILGSVALVTRATARRGREEPRAAGEGPAGAGRETAAAGRPQGYDPGIDKPLERCA